MAALFPLEDFDAPASPPATAPPDQPAAPTDPAPELIEAERSAAFEKGYRAGWDDAAAAQSEDESRIGAEFARNLQDLGFTFHEARSHVMRALEPLLGEIVAKVLPRLVTETLGQTVVDELLPLAENASDSPIEVVVSPDARPTLERFLTDATSVPLTIVEENTLAEGQVYLRMGQVERQIDMTSAVDRIGQAIRAVYDLNDKATTHG